MSLYASTAGWDGHQDLGLETAVSPAPEEQRGLVGRVLAAAGAILLRYLGKPR